MQTYVGATKYNMPYYQTAGADDHAAANGAVHTANSGEGMGSLENPAVALLAVVAVCIGLVHVSTSARVGKFAASASAG